MTRGLYRRRKLGKTGRSRDTGAFIIDMRIKRVPELAGIPSRLAKSTGVLPGERNAESTVREMKLMIKELIRKRDARTLQRIQSNKLSLPSAYAKWREGRINLAEQYEELPIVKNWYKYLDSAVLSDSTQTNRRAVVAALLNNGLLNEQHVLNELPARLQAIRLHYQRKKQHSAFNSYRMEILTFLTKGLGLDDDSRLLLTVSKIRTLPLQKRREHHPFYSPRECREFIAKLLKRPTPFASLYGQAVLFMCMHGLRPQEFGNHRFLIDAKTGHLRIRGTKTANADRVVPLSFIFGPAESPNIDTLNMIFMRMGEPVRCRDFRRTFGIWCEAAGIPSSRIRAYLGHAAQTVTQTYLSTVPTQVMLDEDKARLRVWYEAELKKEPPPRDARKVVSSLQALMSLRQPSLEEMQKRILAERKADEERRRKYPSDFID